MPLSEKLLEKLVCPACKNKMEYEEKNNRLIYTTCQLAYKIKNEVPVILLMKLRKYK